MASTDCKANVMKIRTSKQLPIFKIQQASPLMAKHVNREHALGRRPFV